MTSATRPLDPETAEPVHELVPRPPVRVVGPGRRERAYQAEIAQGSARWRRRLALLRRPAIRRRAAPGV